jgi:hypothetical protein
MNNGGRLGAGCEIKSEIHNTISYSGPLIIMRKCSSFIIHADVNLAMAKEKTERQGRSKKPKDGVKFASSKEIVVTNIVDEGGYGETSCEAAADGIKQVRHSINRLTPGKGRCGSFTKGEPQRFTCANHTHRPARRKFKDEADSSSWLGLIE